MNLDEIQIGKLYRLRKRPPVFSINECIHAALVPTPAKKGAYFYSYIQLEKDEDPIVLVVKKSLESISSGYSHGQVTVLFRNKLHFVANHEFFEQVGKIEESYGFFKD